MKITQGLTVGLSSLRKNKLRVLLTTLGIIIGIAAVIGMVSIGDGAKQLVLAEFQRIGASNLLVVFRPDTIKENGKRVKNTSPEFLKYEDALEILESCPSVENVSAEMDLELPASFGRNNEKIKVSAGTPEYEDAHNWYVQEGRFLDKHDVETAALVCAVGTEIQKDLFEDINPVGKELKIANIRFSVIGVMTEKGDKMATEGWDNTAIMPLTTMQKRFMGNDIVWVMLIQAKSFDLVDKALAEVKLVLRRQHGRADKIFEYFVAKEAMEAVGKVSLILKVLLGGIASIALFVGGVGIMNIMLVSVTERTKEIGLRKAVGAKRADILIQFLIESLVISLVGGIIGIMIGVLVGMLSAWAISTFLIKEVALPSVVSMQAGIIAFFTAATIGIVSGLYPAYKAARLTPTEALRRE